MANQNSTQYAKLETLPPTRLYAHEQVGKVRRIYAEIVLSAEIGTTDTIYMAKLPKGSVPIAFKAYGPAATSGAVQIGWDAGDNSLETADANGFCEDSDISSAMDVNYNSVNNSVVGLNNKRFEDTVNVVLTATTITSGWIGDTIKMEILYINE